MSENEIEEMKKKYESKNYILIARQNNSAPVGKWYEHIQPCCHQLEKTKKYLDYKLIHKKHKDILDEYFKHKEIGVLHISGDIAGIIDGDTWIEHYDENNIYELSRGKAPLKDKQAGQNDGSKNNFYQLPDWVKDCDTLSEYLNLDPYEFNILKTLWTNKGKRHNGTSKEREINKCIHYANKRKEKYERNTKLP